MPQILGAVEGPQNTFDPAAVLEVMESMRNPENGAFKAALTPDYDAMWLRDHLFCTFAYLYLGDYEKFKAGVALVFKYFKLNRKTLITRICSPIAVPGGILHAKVDSQTLAQVTTDKGWGHHQVDALGLFFFIVAEADRRDVKVAKDPADREILRLLVAYLRSVEYWEKPDLGMWEECLTRKMTSIGFAVSGLSHIKHQGLATVPDPLVEFGQKALDALWPNESKDQCARPQHSHDCDAAQLFLIWPCRVIGDTEKQNELLGRILNGHEATPGQTHCLLQKNGLNRYWGDDYYRSGAEGKYISAEWTMFFFLLCIVYADRHEYTEAEKWFTRGCDSMIENKVPEEFHDGKPGIHTPLAWGQALALIAWTKLGAEQQKKFTPAPKEGLAVVSAKTVEKP